MTPPPSAGEVPRHTGRRGATRPPKHAYRFVVVVSNCSTAARTVDSRRAFEMSLSDLWDFISTYQTLIAGLIALLAAYVTARPVWRQIEGMRVQTNTLFRNYVLEQIRRTDNRRDWYSKRLKSFNEDVNHQIYEMEEREGGTMNPEWAHHTEQRAICLTDELRRHEETRDLSAIEKERSEVIDALGKLIETLDSIHRPHSIDRHDPEYSFSDEQWDALKRAGEKAEAELASVANTLSEASKRLDDALVRELSAYRLQLKQVQSSLQKVKI